MVKYLFLTGMILMGLQVAAQQNGQRVINMPGRTELFNTRRDTITIAQVDFATDSFLYTKHPYYSFTQPTRYMVSIRQWESKDLIFYVLTGILILFALIKNGFQRYIQDLFKIFFRTTIRQKQVKEQLFQNPLPALFLNVFALLSVGMFLALLLQHFERGVEYNLWVLFLYNIISLLVIYVGKFLVLKFLGWVLQIKEATDAYIFIVFATNKIIGMCLLPLLVLLALTYGIVSQSAIVVGIIVFIGLFLYRYFISYLLVHKQIRLNFFHFSLYLCAFEIVPFLVINKLLLRFLS